jgi:hypothetical protein
MNMKTIISLLAVSLIKVQICFLFAQTDYSDLNNWAFHPDKSGTLLEGYNLDIAIIDKNLQIDSVIPISNNSMINTGVDVFFVHPTILSGIYYLAGTIPIGNQNSFLVNATIITQGGLLSKYGRFFAPRYRQSTPPTYGKITPPEMQADTIMKSYSDIKSAFLYYLNNYNNGNKIILAGHSQGSYLLGFLLRDVFDNDEELQDKLVTAALGGMNYVYAPVLQYAGGWWKNIPLCTEFAENNCIQNWSSFKEGQDFPPINTGSPIFNKYLADSGLIYKTIDTMNHWVVQDSLYYGLNKQPLRFYIAPDAGYNLGEGTGFISFDSLYTIRLRREGSTQIGLNVSYFPEADDQRPNDLINVETDPFFSFMGYHVKDYHIYLWALLQQIDAKLDQNKPLGKYKYANEQLKYNIYPNPCRNDIHVKLTKGKALQINTVKIIDVCGNTIISNADHINGRIDVSGLYPGLYFLRINSIYTAKFVVEP